MTTTAPILETRALHKSFAQAQQTLEILRGVELRVEPGETLAILGQSGSGKSTLLSLLAGLDLPSSGEVLVQGQSLSQLDEESLSRFRGRNIGIVFQQFHLIGHLNALENIALPLWIAGDNQADAKATQALAQVGLEKRAGHRPEQLSGGECQRIAIARALAVRPALLLADEPSGNLDSKTGQQIADLLFRVVEENRITLILVTHDEVLARRCRNRRILADGQLRPQA